MPRRVVVLALGGVDAALRLEPFDRQLEVRVREPGPAFRVRGLLWYSSYAFQATSTIASSWRGHGVERRDRRIARETALELRARQLDVALSFLYLGCTHPALHSIELRYDHHTA